MTACCHDATFFLTKGGSCYHQEQPGSLLIPTLCRQPSRDSTATSLACFTPSPSAGCPGLKWLTAGRRAPGSSRRLSLPTPCCPACRSARLPPRGKQRLGQLVLTSEEGWEVQPCGRRGWRRTAFYFVLVSNKSYGKQDPMHSIEKPPCRPHQEDLPLQRIKKKSELASLR